MKNKSEKDSKTSLQNIMDVYMNLLEDTFGKDSIEVRTAKETGIEFAQLIRDNRHRVDELAEKS